MPETLFFDTRVTSLPWLSGLVNAPKVPKIKLKRHPMSGFARPLNSKTYAVAAVRVFSSKNCSDLSSERDLRGPQFAKKPRPAKNDANFDRHDRSKVGRSEAQSAPAQYFSIRERRAACMSASVNAPSENDGSRQTRQQNGQEAKNHCSLNSA